jgi:FdhD protein
LVVAWDNGRADRVLDDVAREEPLEIRIGDEQAGLVMRTPGHDSDLAIGFLLSEGVIDSLDDVAGCVVVTAADGRSLPNTVRVDLRTAGRFDPARFARTFSPSSGCGVCGRASIDAVRARRSHPLNAAFRLVSSVLSALPDSLRHAQPTFARTGGLHAAALFGASGAIHLVREDIGRHNAVDKVIGAALVEGDRIPLAERGLLVSGRGGFEIVQKAIVAGIPLVACISAPSSLAVQLAREAGQTLIGFLRGSRFVVYAGEERIRQG